MFIQIRCFLLSIYLTAVFAFLPVGIAQAEVFLPAFQSDLARVSCQVRRVTRDQLTGQEHDEAHGSGTFINSRLFITAGHVVTGFYYPFHHHEFLKTYIACPGGKNVAVKSWIFHPKFFNPAVLNSENQIDYPVKIEGSDTFVAMDMAVLVTEETHVPGPRLALAPQDLHEQLQSNSCRLLGYSPSKCIEQTGENCHRHVNLAARKISAGFLSVDNIMSFESGDSGSGIVCGPSDNKVLVGIFRSRAKNEEGLSLLAKKEFIEPLLSMDEESLAQKASEIQFSEKFIQASQQFAKAQLIVGADQILLTTGIALSDSLKVTESLIEFSKQNPRAFGRWNQILGIKYIRLVSADAKAPAIIQGQFLNLSSEVTQTDLRGILE